jgi:hypothetical protein
MKVVNAYNVRYINQLYNFLVNLSSGNLNKINLPLIHTQLYISKNEAIENHEYIHKKLEIIEERIKILENKK